VKINSLYFYQRIEKFSIWIFFIFFVLQVAFQLSTQHIKPNVHVVPDLPSKYSIKALSLGDEEFYFRVLGLKIQNAGDTFGRSVPLKDYDYEKLYHWFTIMDGLNSDSRIIPSLASYYYSQTQNKKDTIHLIRYLDEHAAIDVDKHWWWLYQAIFIAKMSLKDEDIALDLAYKLSKNENKNAPLWTKQLPAFFLAKMGQECEAFFIINQILKDNESGKREIKPEEMDFMRHFIKSRLNDLKKKKFDPRKCKKKS
jgi:hypothetical protein